MSIKAEHLYKAYCGGLGDVDYKGQPGIPFNEIWIKDQDAWYSVEAMIDCELERMNEKIAELEGKLLDLTCLENELEWQAAEHVEGTD